MKRKLKYFLLLFGLLAICTIHKVNAETYQEKFNERYKAIANTFVSKTKGSSTNYQQMFVMARKSDNQFVYCIEPGTSIDENALYTGQDYDQAYVANMTETEWERIQLLAYYGYGYSDSEVDHSDLKWYAVTQFMIWQTVPHGYDIYFTDSLNGNRITRYINEMAEMEALLSKHYIIPDFGKTSFDVTIGETLQLTDNNGVLTQYSVSSDSDIDITQSGNTLYLTANAIGNAIISLAKKDVKYAHSAIVYIKEGTQDVMQVGSYDPIKKIINLNAIGVDVEIYKQDSETGSIPQGQATLKGALYGLYTLDGTLVTELTTDNNGYALAEKVALEKDTTYYIKEISPSEGYYLDNTKYSFTYTGEEKVTINVKEIVVKNYISILKQYDYVDGNTTILHPEKNITFDIFYPDGTKYSSITTDVNGYASITIPYGVWRFSQVNTNDGFSKISDFYVTVDYNSNLQQYYNILNNKINAYLQLIKKDSETGKTIAIANTTFKILNTDTNQYVSQYVAGKVYSEFTTDENGTFITYLPLEAGNYRLIEISEPNGYMLDVDGLDFNIGNDTHYYYSDYGAFVVIEFENVPIKGVIEVNKTGEVVKIENGAYEYVVEPLEGIVFNIYANEDILTTDGNYLYYQKGDLVDTIITDENGYAISKELPLGSYFIVEVQTQDSYILNSKEYHFTLSEIDNKTAIVYESYSLLNYLEKGTLEFTKTDLTTGVGIPNTKIDIYKINDGSNELIFSGITNENGKIIISDLFIGKFYIVETEPTTGYRLSNEKIYFEIKENGDVVKANMTNEKIKGSLEFTKTDFSTGETIPNTLIEIYSAETDKLIFSGRTDENGKIIIKELEYGKYYILEKECEGYVLNEERMYFEILEDGEIVKTTMENQKISSIVKIHKVDESGNPLAGVTIGIFDLEDNLLGSYITDENGDIEIELEYGFYYYQELQTIDGYVLNNEKIYFSVVEDGAIIENTLVNIKVPNTSLSDSKVLDAFGIVLMIAGVGYIIYAKKKK